jgi:hypothetical protein
MDRTLMLHDPALRLHSVSQIYGRCRQGLLPSWEPPPTMSSDDPDCTLRNSVDGIRADQKKFEESKNDPDAEGMFIGGKSAAHDYDPPALKSRSYETFDIERQ